LAGRKARTLYRKVRKLQIALSDSEVAGELRRRAMLRGDRRLRAVCALAVATGTLGLGVTPASATPGTISTIAGGLGAGAPTTVGQDPVALAASGSRLWVADGRFTGFVVRRIDTNTGVETPVLTLSNDDYGHDPTIAAGGAGDAYVSSFSPSQGWHVDELLPSGQTRVVAGGGALNHVDGVPATSEKLDTIEGLTADAAGNLYLSENTWQTPMNSRFPSNTDARIRKVAPDGTITTVAGIGPSSAPLGDGGPARLAALSEPRGLATDDSGNLYIADYGHQRVRRVDSSTGAFITTVAGGGTSTADGVPATSASVSPDAIAIDGKRLLIGDTLYSKLRAVTGSTITTVAGNGDRGYSGDGGPATAAAATPDEIAVGPAGIFLTQFTLPGTAHVIRLVDRTGTISHYAGTGWQYFGGDGGPAAEAQFTSVGDLAPDRAGNLYVTDDGNVIDRRVRKIDASGTMTTVAGTGVYAGNQGAGDGGPATQATFGSIDHIAVAPNGDLYI
jgi:hypothetical protein